MENSFVIYSNRKIEIHKFHICSWEFSTEMSLLEFGCEITKDSIVGINKLLLTLYIPWLSIESEVIDLYQKLSNTANSRFIFNDSVDGSDSFDGGINKAGIIHKFKDRGSLCILPLNINVLESKLNIEIDLKRYNSLATDRPNIYFRFCIKLKGSYISTRKHGINKSTIIYDIKVNEMRNIAVGYLDEFEGKEFCTINNCFCFNILPTRYDMVFPDSSLKNVRTLEHSSFSQYLGRIIDIPKDELMVVFNKKKESFTFFSIYTQERIGPAQFAAAILINILCGILLFIPSYRKTFTPPIGFFSVWKQLPVEIYLSIAIAMVTVLYFIWPKVWIKLNGGGDRAK